MFVLFLVCFGCFFFAFSCFIMLPFLIYEYLFWLCRPCQCSKFICFRAQTPETKLTASEAVAGMDHGPGYFRPESVGFG